MAEVEGRSKSESVIEFEREKLKGDGNIIRIGEWSVVIVKLGNNTWELPRLASVKINLGNVDAREGAIENL